MTKWVLGTDLVFGVESHREDVRFESSKEGQMACPFETDLQDRHRATVSKSGLVPTELVTCLRRT